MDIKEFVGSAISKEISVKDTLKRAISEAKEINKQYNYLVEVATPVTPKKKGRLYGLPVSVKDCICVQGMQSRAGSKILEGYIPYYESTAIKRLIDEGAVIIGKTSQDVFGFGSFDVNTGVGFKIPKNPFDKDRATGGSSGGAAGLTQKMSSVHLAIAESTGGSIACPAAYCGVIGLTPTYGRVSRYGLIDYANSMDKIGVMSKNIEDIALALEIISGYDPKDATSAEVAVGDYTLPKKRAPKIAVVKESLSCSAVVKKNLFAKLANRRYDEVSLPLTFKYGVQTYYLISLSEASTNLARYCGMRYGFKEELSGNFNDYFSRVRSKAFSKEEKRRIILGTFARMSGFRDAYYLKALKVRTLIIEEYKKLFKRYDIIITPTMPNIAPRFSEIDKMTPLENFMMDILTVGPNIAGLPHISIPSGFSEGMPTGMMAITDHFKEHELLDFARQII